MDSDISVFDILSPIPLSRLALKVASKSKFIREDIALLAQDEATEWVMIGDIIYVFWKLLEAVIFPGFLFSISVVCLFIASKGGFSLQVDPPPLPPNTRIIENEIEINSIQPNY